MLPGIDVSYAQGSIAWGVVARSGASLVKWVISRVSYGARPADNDGPIFNDNHDECQKFGIPFGAYHFFLFSDDPKAQADLFLGAANGRYGSIRPTVDVEEGSGTLGSVEANVAALTAFNDEIRKELGCDPIIYTNADTWDGRMGGTDAFSGHSLWVANYPATAGRPAMPKGWTDWAIHQYSDKGQPPGIKGYVDLDVVHSDSLDGLLR